MNATEKMTSIWMVTDLSDPDPWGARGPQFGPFDSQQGAEEFATSANAAVQRRLGGTAPTPYWAHDIGRS